LWKLWVQGNPKTPFETSPLFIDVANKFSDELQKCAKANSKPAGCVLTFWSYIVFGPSEINALAKHNIAVRYLYGPKEKCIEAAFGRDPAKWSQDDSPARAHWCQHNQTYQRIGGPGLSEYRVDAFQPSGDRRSEFEIAAELLGPAPGRVWKVESCHPTERGAEEVLFLLWQAFSKNSCGNSMSRTQELFDVAIANDRALRERILKVEMARRAMP
jgi:hypothetical protein